jgi:2-haloacid dehalogenase
MERAFIFDVFGTLVDWREGVARAVEDACRGRDFELDAHAFADAWRGEYEPAMQRVRAGDRGYVPLDILHRENLDATLAQFGAESVFDEAARTALNHAWEQLPPWPDVVAGLSRLRGLGFLAPCSNASIPLSVRLARFAGLQWDVILGAQIAQNYKPEPQVYLAACDALGLRPAQVMMVAAHNDDLAAARGAGLQTAFIARPLEYGAGQATELMAQADWTCIARDLNDLAAQLGG